MKVKMIEFVSGGRGQQMLKVVGGVLAVFALVSGMQPLDLPGMPV